MSRPLCAEAKKGRVCSDDMCRSGGETLCGFDPNFYAEMCCEDYDPDFTPDDPE